MTPLQVTYRPLGELIIYVRNARTHSEEQVIQLMGSITEFGWTNPILVDENGRIIAGHGRLLAAQRLKMDMVPTITLAGLSEAQKRALVLADNKLALNAGWDTELLRIEIGDLNGEGFDLALTGFSVEELAAYLAPKGSEGNTDPDDAPGVPTHPITQPGDVWILGRHRLVCGDATSADDVAKALNGVRPHLMVTDPPYGVDYKPADRANKARDGAKRAMGRVTNDDRSDWGEAWALFPGDVAYVWHAMRTAFEVEGSLRQNAFAVRSQIVWKKNRPTISPANINLRTAGYSPQHECCFYLIREGGKTGWLGGRSQSTVWEIDHAKSDTGHATQKPVQAMQRPIENSSSPGQAVYEPFSGSGTTIIACEITGRACHALEISPAYCDVAVLRWQDFTGQAAILESTGGPFPHAPAAAAAQLAAAAA